ncbi:MAG: molecular chaperone Tir [Flavobacteriales bacterium]|nr:molecular chaperone Tir [Flavobacteriales bacterium]
MKDNFNIVKNYVLDLGYTITAANEEDQIIIIEDESSGIKNCAIGCADPILIMEQHILELNGDSGEVFRSLLMKNRDIIHGAFVLDETGTKVIFRDTLQIENLDMNEIEGSLNSLSLLLTEYADELIKFSKK